MKIKRATFQPDVGPGRVVGGATSPDQMHAANHGKAIKNTVNRLQRHVAIAMLAVRFVAALDRAIQVLERIPAWVYTLAVGLMWLSMAVVGVGKGQDWAVFCAFLGMLWWALQEKNYTDLLHDHIRAMAGWTEAVNALEKAARAPEAGNALGAAPECCQPPHGEEACADCPLPVPAYIASASTSPECAHNNLPVKFDRDDAKGKGSDYVRKNYPRFHGACPDCGALMIGYASFEHYVSGDW